MIDHQAANSVVEKIADAFGRAMAAGVKRKNARLRGRAATIRRLLKENQKLEIAVKRLERYAGFDITCPIGTCDRCDRERAELEAIKRGE